MLTIEKSAQQASAATDRRSKAGIAGNRADDCTSGSTSSPTGQSTLLGFTHPSTPTDGNQYHYEKANGQSLHRLSLTTP
jgi:hypothetical protein